MPNVHYINPGRPDKNIGKAYNEACALIPDGDWICISDQDCLWWPEFVIRQIEDIITGAGKDFALLAACTNRVANKYQRPFPEDFDNMDIMHHRRRAEQSYKESYGLIEQAVRPLAGVFMLFPKSTWQRYKFKERIMFCDTEFFRKASRIGKVGIMKGVYCFHYYRAHSNDPVHYKKHLLA